MRIAVVDMLFKWPPSGGAGTDVREICVRLRKEHDVKIFFPHFENVDIDEIISVDPGVEWQAVNFPRFRHFNFYEAPGKLKKAVSQWKPDKVFITDGYYIKPYIMLAFKDKRPILRIYGHEGLCLRRAGHFFKNNEICDRRFHGSLTDMIACQYCGLKSGQPSFREEYILSLAFMPTYRRIARKAFKVAERVIVYNRWVAELAGKLTDNVEVIPGGVNPKLFLPDTEAVEKTEPVILMVGRIEDFSKGFHVLRNACNKLLKDGLKFKLLVTGRDLVFKEPFIENAGWLSQEELPGLYRKADICVVPSVWPEPFGIVALEAMACEKPVIVSRVGGLGEIFEDGTCGYVVPPGDVEKLAEKLKLLLKNPLLREKFGKEGRRQVINKYTWDGIYETHYKNMFTG